MKAAILFSILVSSWNLIAQCNVKVDEFTKEVLIESKLKKFGSSGSAFSINGLLYIETQVYSLNGRLHLILRPEFSGVKTIEKGESIYFKFENDSILELFTPATQITDFKRGKAFSQGTNNTIWYAYLDFLLTPQQAEYLSTLKIKKLRISGVDYEPNKKNGGQILDQIACVLNPKKG